MKPPFPYFGGKTGLAPFIASLLPRHRVYVEPFAGSAAVLFAKPPVVHEVLNDRSRALTTFLRCLRDQPDEMERLCRLTPYSRDEFVAAKVEEPGISDLEVARRWWVVINQGFNKSGAQNNGWSSSVACQNGEAKTTYLRIARFALAARRLADVTIENRDALEVIEVYGAGPDVVLYVDPPYFAQARASTHTGYPHEYGTEAEHLALAESLHRSPAIVVLSGYESPLYSDIYGDWHRIERSVLRRTSNRAAGTRPRATEVLWSNRPLADGRLFEVCG